MIDTDTVFMDHCYDITHCFISTIGSSWSFLIYDPKSIKIWIQKWKMSIICVLKLFQVYIPFLNIYIYIY